MKELGYYIEQIDDKKHIMVRGELNDGVTISTPYICPFMDMDCGEVCKLLKFEQLNDGYAKNEFDVTFGCTNSTHCSLYVEN